MGWYDYLDSVLLADGYLFTVRWGELHGQSYANIEMCRDNNEDETAFSESVPADQLRAIATLCTKVADDLDAGQCPPQRGERATQ